MTDIYGLKRIHSNDVNIYIDINGASHDISSVTPITSPVLGNNAQQFISIKGDYRL